MFAGGPAIRDSANTAPQLIRFAAKANNVEYEYVAQNRYYTGSNVNLATAIAKHKKAYAASPPAAPPPPPLGISFMPGTIEIKSAGGRSTPTITRLVSMSRRCALRGSCQRSLLF